MSNKRKLLNNSHNHFLSVNRMSEILHFQMLQKHSKPKSPEREALCHSFITPKIAETIKVLAVILGVRTVIVKQKIHTNQFLLKWSCGPKLEKNPKTSSGCLLAPGPKVENGVEKESNLKTILTTPTTHTSKKYAPKICHKMRGRMA